MLLACLFACSDNDLPIKGDQRPRGLKGDPGNSIDASTASQPDGSIRVGINAPTTLVYRQNCKILITINNTDAVINYELNYYSNDLLFV